MSSLRIKNLVGNFALTPWPLDILGEVIRWQIPILRKIGSFRNGKRIGKVNLELLKEAGYDGIELTLWGLFDENWEINNERLKEYKKRNLPFYTFHGCFEAFPPRFKNAYLNLTENDPKIKKAIRSHVDVVAELKRDKRTILVFHPGKIKRGQTKYEAFKNLIENIGSHLEYAKKHDVILTLENMPYYFNAVPFCQNYLDFQYIFKKIQHPNLKITFDWGHLNTQLLNRDFREYIKNKNNYKEKIFPFFHINEFVDRIGKNIVHAHLHYNRCHKILEFANLEPNLGFLKNFIIHFFFWTNLARYLRKSAQSDSLDEHLSFDKIEERYVSDFQKTLENLMTKSSILDCGFVTHEFVPRHVFKVLTYQKSGAKSDDFKKSLQIFNELIPSSNI